MNTILTTEEKSERLLKIQANADIMMTLGRAISAAAYCIMHEDAHFRSTSGGDNDIIGCPSLEKYDIVKLLLIMEGLETEIAKAADELDQQLIPG